MQEIDEKRFTALAEKYNLIPVFREYAADIVTPVSALGRLAADDGDMFLLESVESRERFGRYSFIGIDPRGKFTVENAVPYYADANGKRELKICGSAFETLREMLKEINAPELAELPPLFGGAVGYMNYEAACEFETLPRHEAGADEVSCAFMLLDELVIFDNVRHTMKIVACTRPAEFATPEAAYLHALDRIRRLHRRISTPYLPPARTACEHRAFTAEIGRDEYIAKVEAAKRLIREGEAIQIVLSQKFHAELNVPPIDLYRALRLINPSPYTFFLRIGGTLLIGSSPEALVKLDRGAAVLRPIAGSRVCRLDASDGAVADELLKDEKERAEHLMLVDLARNDLGRIALPGSVQVKEFMRVERYSHIMHLVSQVEALPAPECDAFSLVRATFPAGTLTGAPKIRAMELIYELEGSPRNAYGGALGYFSYSRNMDMAITIRTLVIRDGRITVQAGAGIVADSDGGSEYAECAGKAQALFHAVELAARGIDFEGVAL